MVIQQGFSPPAWGWSGRRAINYTPRAVFPTRVGMVRVSGIGLITE